MSTGISSPVQTDYPSTSDEVVCPYCGGVVYRVKRRWIDRLASLFKPVHRYRCQTLSCRWEGNLPVD